MFQKPLKVSKGIKNDEIMIRIINNEYFISAETGEIIEDKHTKAE